jgi:hypothetical protein
VCSSDLTREPSLTGTAYSVPVAGAV